MGCTSLLTTLDIATDERGCKQNNPSLRTLLKMTFFQRALCFQMSQETLTNKLLKSLNSNIRVNQNDMKLLHVDAKTTNVIIKSLNVCTQTSRIDICSTTLSLSLI